MDLLLFSDMLLPLFIVSDAMNFRLFLQYLLGMVDDKVTSGQKRKVPKTFCRVNMFDIWKSIKRCI